MRFWSISDFGLNSISYCVKVSFCMIYSKTPSVLFVLYVYHIIELTKVQIKVIVARFQRKTHFIQFRITNQLITEKIRLFTVSLENLIQTPLKPKSPLPLLFFFYFYLFQLTPWA